MASNKVTSDERRLEAPGRSAQLSQSVKPGKVSSADLFEAFTDILGQIASELSTIREAAQPQPARPSVESNKDSRPEAQAKAPDEREVVQEEGQGNSREAPRELTERSASLDSGEKSDAPTPEEPGEPVRAANDDQDQEKVEVVENSEEAQSAEPNESAESIQVGVAAAACVKSEPSIPEELEAAPATTQVPADTETEDPKTEAQSSPNVVEAELIKGESPQAAAEEAPVEAAETQVVQEAVSSSPEAPQPEVIQPKPELGVEPVEVKGAPEPAVQAPVEQGPAVQEAAADLSEHVHMVEKLIARIRERLDSPELRSAPEPVAQPPKSAVSETPAQFQVPVMPEFNAAQLGGNLVRNVLEIGGASKGNLLTGNGNGNNKGLAQQPLMQGMAAQQREAAAGNEQAARTRPAMRPEVQRALERVEQALKEVARSRDGKTISLRLDPPHLGSVKIDVSLRDGVMHARVTAEAPHVAQLLREKSHELQTVLRQAGVDSEEVTVSVGSGNEGGSRSSDMDQQQPLLNKPRYPSLRAGSGGMPDSVPARNAASEAVADHWVA